MNLDLFAPLTAAGWAFHLQRLAAFGDEHGFRPLAFTGLAVVILAGLIAGPRPDRTGAPGPTSDGPPPRALSATWIRLAAFASGALALSLHLGSLGGVAHTADERAYVYQAGQFRHGRLASRPGGLPLEAAGDTYVIPGPRGLASKYNPGWSALLVPGVALGCPGLVPAALWIATILLAQAFFERRLGETWGAVATLLLATSPMGILTAANLLSHAAALFWVLFGWVAADQEEERPRASTAGLGLATLALATTRLPDVLLLVPALVRRSVRRPPHGVILLIFLGIGLGIDAGYNRAAFGITGLTAHHLANPRDRFGFTPEAGQGQVVYGHNLAAAGFNLMVNALMMNEELWGWAGTSLFWVALGLGAWARGGAGPGTDPPLGAVLLVTFLGGYFHDGGSHGARYYTGLLPILALLSVAGLRHALGPGPVPRPGLIGLALVHLVMAGSYLQGRGRALVHYAGVHSRLNGVTFEGPRSVTLVPDPPDDTADLYPSLFTRMDPTFRDGPLAFRLAPLAREARRRGVDLPVLIQESYPGWSLTLVRFPGRTERLEGTESRP